jgi:heme/copper-type cytochrome/quinol oxidase subunit 2
MATFLDVGLLNYFSSIYPFLFVLVLVYALLQKTKALGESIGTNATVAVAAALMTMLSQTLIDVINFMIPWFVVMIIFLVLVILVFQLFGAKESDLTSAMKDKSVYWTLIGIALVIMVAAFGKVLGQSLTEASFQTGDNTVNVTEGGVATPSFEANIYATLFHPKVLGLIIMFGIAIFAVAFLSA